MHGPSFADRPDWKYSFFLASFEQPLDMIAEPVLRQKCAVCNGPLVRIQRVEWCTHCHSVSVDIARATTCQEIQPTP